MGNLRGGRLSLRLDAVYCAVGAVLLLVSSGPLARTLGLHPAVTVALAVGVAAWAFILHRAAIGPNLRRTLVLVLAANVAAATLIAVFAVLRPWPGWFTVLCAAVAAEVTMFAVSQAAALRR